MNNYKTYNYCTTDKQTFSKDVKRCPICNQKLRTKPKGQYGKKHPELVRI